MEPREETVDYVEIAIPPGETSEADIRRKVRDVVDSALQRDGHRPDAVQIEFGKHFVMAGAEVILIIKFTEHVVIPTYEKLILPELVAWRQNVRERRRQMKRRPTD